MSKITRRRLLASSAIAGILAASEAKARFLGGQPAPAGSQSIFAVNPPTGSFAGGTGSAGTVIATATATMSPASPAFTGTWSLSGTNAASFTINSTTGVLAVGASDVASGTYNVNIVATQTGATGSPFSQACVITGIAIGGVVASVDFTNSGGTVSNKPVEFGWRFRKGDMPTGSSPLLKTAAGVTMVTQVDEIGQRFADGSMSFCAISGIHPPSVSAGANFRVNIATQAAGSPGTPRAVSEIQAHNFILTYNEVTDGALTPISGSPYTFSVNTAIAANRYEITRNGDVYLGVTVYGPLGDPGGNLHVKWYFQVYTDPANTANVLYIEHMPFVSNPFVDASVQDMFIGYFVVKDGATVLRDFGADTFSRAPGDVITGGLDTGRINAPALVGAIAPTQNGVPLKLTLQSGSGNALPGGLSARVYFVEQRSAVGSTLRLHETPTIYGSSAAITDQGTAGGGTPTPFIFNRRQIVNSYMGVFLPSDDLATPFRSGSAWPDFELNLDATDGGVAQKQYLIAAGAIPPWDVSVAATPVGIGLTELYSDASMTSIAGPLYIPGTNGLINSSLGAGSTDYDYGPFCEWEARNFARMGKTGWRRDFNQVMRCQALAIAGMPAMQVSRTATPLRPVVCNNGPNNWTTIPYHTGTGGTYTGMGPSDPEMWFNQDASNHMASPVHAASHWCDYPFANQLTADHWPLPGIIPTILFMKRWNIDQLRSQAMHMMITTGDFQGLFGAGGVFNNQWKFPTTFPNGTAGMIFYAKVFLGGQERDDMGMMPIVAATMIGKSSDPEVAMFKDQTEQMYQFINYWINGYFNQSSSESTPGLKTTGYWMWARTVAPWMWWGYGATAYAYMSGLSRHPLASEPVKAMATGLGDMWSGHSGLGQYWIPAYLTVTGTQAHSLNAGPSTTGYPKSSETGFFIDGGVTLDTTGIFTITNFSDGNGSFMPHGQGGVNPLANGDRIWMGNVSQTNTTAYTGPPEYNPRTIYYLCQLGVSGNAYSFRLSPNADFSAPITASTAFGAGALFLCLRPQYDVTSGLLSQGNNANPTGATYSNMRCSMYMADILFSSSAAVPMSNSLIDWPLALSKMESWNQIDFKPLLGPTSAGFKWNTTNAVRVV